MEGSCLTLARSVKDRRVRFSTHNIPKVYERRKRNESVTLTLPRSMASDESSQDDREWSDDCNVGPFL